MLAILLASGVGVLVVAIVFGLTFMRSSKKLPATWSQWHTELEWQLHGAIGLVEDQVLWYKNRTAIISQKDRVAVITGGNRGIGLSVVDKLLQCDFTVVMGVRDPAAAKVAVEASTSVDLTKSAGSIVYERLDIGNMQSVRQFAAAIKPRFPRIHVLIANAGIMAAPYALTADGFEEQLAVNYLGHFLLAHLLLPELEAAGTKERKARIVNVSSCVHKIGKINFEDLHGKNYSYPPTAYNQSKLAQVVFTKHLEQLLVERHLPIQVHVIHPGIVDTGLFQYSTSTYIPWFKRLLFKTAEEGARTILHAAIAPQLEGKGGSYISNCSLASSAKVAKDERVRTRLFEESCRMLGIGDYFRVAAE